MARRQEQIRSLETAIAAATSALKVAREGTEKVVAEIAATFDRPRRGLMGAPEEARQALRALFPRGLYFEAEGNHWTVTGAPRFEGTATSPACATPAGHDSI